MAVGAQTVRHSSPWLREAQSPSTTQAEINDTRAAQSPEGAQGQAHVQRHREEAAFLSEGPSFGFVALKERDT